MTVTRENILKAAKKVSDLPSFPDVVVRLEHELGKHMPSLREVARIVEQDPMLSAQFLRVANSAYYSRVKATTSIAGAVNRLGFIEARKLAIATALIDRYKQHGGERPDLFWGHSLAVALATRAVSSFSTKELSEETMESSFAAGLLHDLGILVLLHIFPKEYEELTQEIRNQGGIASDIERSNWGVDHGEVGEVLAKQWKLPDAICQVIRYHHQPWLADPEHRTLVQLVHLSNFICNNQGFGRREAGFPDSFDHAAWDSLGLSLEQVPEITEKVSEEGERSTLFVKAFG